MRELWHLRVDYCDHTSLAMSNLSAVYVNGIGAGDIDGERVGLHNS
jgi:hypothetical protein